MACLCATERWNWDTWTGEEQEDCGEEEEEYDGEEYDASGPHCDDDNFIVSRLIFPESIILSSQLVACMAQRSAGQQVFSVLCFDFVLVKRDSLTKSHPVETDGCRLRPQPADSLQEEEEKGEEEDEERGYATNGQKEEKVSLCRGHHQKQTCV